MFLCGKRGSHEQLVDSRGSVKSTATLHKDDTHHSRGHFTMTSVHMRVGLALQSGLNVEELKVALNYKNGGLAQLG